MPDDSLSTDLQAASCHPSLLSSIRERTPARLLAGRAGLSYPTATQLGLRLDHAAAMDAVHRELAPEQDFGADFLSARRLFTVSTLARDKQQYLLRPDLGRRLSDTARAEIVKNCPARTDLQIAIGDGLSAAAVAAQVPTLLPLLETEALSRGWSLGRTMIIRHARVGTMNDLGELLAPQVLVLLIGERPGLATAESLSAYMAFCPRVGHTDAHRNLISNIHAAGISPIQAAGRIIALAELLREKRASGIAIKEVSLQT